uniref:Uncharacterized protein n=1 Tax=Setaria viridis TaxID=4556 RepID=A0A4U6U726_SETVI|nr:hypothetical protein SEVIR_6G233150v2 [Setaria viridis]
MSIGKKHHERLVLISTAPVQPGMCGLLDPVPLKFLKLPQREVGCCWPIVGHLTDTTGSKELGSYIWPVNKIAQACHAR